MNNLKDIIIEKLKINKDTSFKDLKTIISNIDPTGFKWESAYSDNDYQAKCKKNAHDFADEVYPNLPHIYRIEQLFKDTLAQYVKSTYREWSNDGINEYCKKSFKYLDEYGWNKFSYSYVEQGWWAFIYWLKNKID